MCEPDESRRGLVSIVPQATHACNGDSQHLHLQVKMGGAVYDVAVNVDGLEAEISAPLPGSAWTEGWHADDELDSVKDLTHEHSTGTVREPHEPDEPDVARGMSGHD